MEYERVKFEKEHISNWASMFPEETDTESQTTVEIEGECYILSAMYNI